MDKDYFDEPSSVGENIVDNSSEDEDKDQDDSSGEEDKDQDDSSGEEDKDQDDSSGEEDSSSAEEDSEEKSNSDEEDSTEESSSMEEGNNLTKGRSVVLSCSIAPNIKLEFSKDSAEDNDTTEDDSVEYGPEAMGLVFQDIRPVDQTVKIVTLGHEGCGKTELIERFFSDRLFYTKYGTRTEYNVSLTKYFKIWICDVIKTEYLEKETFSDKTVFLLCYDVEDRESFTSLSETCISRILKKSMKEMYCLFVGIKSEPKTEPKAKKFKKEDQEIAVNVKNEELNNKFSCSRFIKCFLEDKYSLLNVFQSAINFVYPRVELV